MTNENEFLTATEITQLSDLMNRKHAAFRDDRSFSIKIWEDCGAVYVTVLFTNQNETFYYPVEARIDCQEAEMEKREAALFLIDYADLYFEDFLEKDCDIYLPIEWSGFEYDAVKFQLRGQIRNRAVDKMAEDLLNGHPDAAESLLN